MTALIIDPSRESNDLIAKTLSHLRLTFVASADEASILLRDNRFDVVILELELAGDRDGFSLLSEMQSILPIEAPAIFCLTARAALTDKVTAFSLGVDDFIAKPYDPIELRIRIDGKMRKRERRRNQDSRTVVGGIEVDHGRHRVTIRSSGNPKEISVTQAEFKLLCCLIKRPEQVYTREQLLHAAWGDNAQVLERVVDVHICLLRKKLAEYAPCIRSVPGVGYKLVPSAYVDPATLAQARQVAAGY